MVVRVLLDANADTKILDRDSQSAGDIAYSRGNTIVSNSVCSLGLGEGGV